MRSSDSSLLLKIALALAFVATFILTLFGLRFFLMGPQLAGLPSSEQVVDSARYHLEFSVRNTKEIHINGQEVVAQEGGLVEHTLRLAGGLNQIAIDVSDRYGHNKRHILYITYPQGVSIPD